MRILSVASVFAICGFSAVAAKSAWSFEDATVAMQSQEEGGGVKQIKEKLNPQKPFPSPISLASKGQIRISLTTTEDKKAKKPHQAFFTLTDTSSGLEESFPLIIKDTGKGGVSVAQKDIPLQLFTASQPLRGDLIVASFGSSTPLRTHVLDLALSQDSNAPVQAPPAPLRYGKLPEIHHIFRSDPETPPVFITALFGCFIFAALPILLGVWLEVGMNLNHLPEAFRTAPIAHSLFVGSIVALETIFGLYYLRLTLFQALPAVAVVGVVAFLSGTRALGEVQGRRLAGKR